jgi:RNA-binding protein
LDTTLMVGKSGVTEAVIAEAENLLTARELVKGKVLEGALMSPREVSDEICEATGAEGVAVIGTKFVIYRFSEKCQEERNQTGRAKRKSTPVSKADPVRKGIRARRAAAKKVRQQRNEYFRQQAIERSIEKSRERQLRGEE